jgi:P-type conjugative transfer protein TrbJ
MTHRPLRRVLLAGVVVLSLGVAAPPAMAVSGIVYDPTNYAQNLLQAARALQQIQNQISSLQNEAAMLLNEAKHLQQLPFSALQGLQQDMSKITGLLGQASRVAYDVQAIKREFQQNYPAAFSASATDQSLTASAQARWLNSIEAFQLVLDVQAGVVGTLASTQGQAGDLVGQSQGAVGALQATQAGNQLLALQSKQLADLTALLAAQGRADALEQARQAESAAEAKERLRRFLGTGQGYQPQSVQMFYP